MMARFWIALALAAAAACTPPAPTTAPAETPNSEAPAEPVADLGPYTNTWDSAEFSRFRHTLRAATPGAHAITLQAQTDSSGGETVAVYPIGADGERRTVRIIFVVAQSDGTTGDDTIEIPSEGLPVEVAVENAGGRRHAGSYTITIEP